MVCKSGAAGSGCCACGCRLSALGSLRVYSDGASSNHRPGVGSPSLDLIPPSHPPGPRISQQESQQGWTRKRNTNERAEVVGGRNTYLYIFNAGFLFMPWRGKGHCCLLFEVVVPGPVFAGRGGGSALLRRESAVLFNSFGWLSKGTDKTAAQYCSS